MIESNNIRIHEKEYIPNHLIICVDKVLLEKLAEEGKYESLLQLTQSGLDDLYVQNMHLFALWKLEFLDEAIQKGEQWEHGIGVKIDESVHLFYLRMGTIYTHFGNILKGIDYSKLALSVAEQLGNKQSISYALNNLAFNYYLIGDLQEAEKHCNRSLKISEEISDSENIASISHILGDIYFNYGDYENSLKYYLSTVKFLPTLDGSLTLLTCQVSICNLYFEIGDQERAKDTFEQITESYKKLGTEIELTNSFYDVINLIGLYVYLGDSTSAQEYLSKLQDFSSLHPYKPFQLAYLYAEGIYHKSRDRLKEKVQAVKMFKEIINNFDIRFDYTIKSMFHLVDLLLFEFKMSNDISVKNEILYYVDQIRNFAKKQDLISYVIKSNIIEAKFFEIDGEIEKAEEYYLHSMNLLKQLNLNLLLKTVVSEYNHFHENIVNISNLVKQNATLSERIEASKIEEYLELVRGLKESK